MKQKNGYVQAMQQPIEQKHPATKGSRPSCEDLAQVCITRDQIHRVLVGIGQTSFQKPMPRKEDKQLPARISQEDVHVFEPAPLDTTTLAKRWNFPEAAQVVEWLLTIVDPQAKARPYSWF